MSDVAAVRRASPEDAAAVARLLHDFQLEFDEPSPGVEVLAERHENQLRDGDVTVLVGAGPDGFAQLRFRPWVYDGLHSYLEELYVVPSLRGKGLGPRFWTPRWMSRGTRVRRKWSSGRAKRTRPRALYESAGFTNREGSPDGPVMFFYEREL